MIFARVSVEARSGFYDDLIARNQKNTMVRNSDGDREDHDGWKVSRMGMKTRATTIKEEYMIPFAVSLPKAPSGYIFSSINEDFQFEVVVD